MLELLISREEGTGLGSKVSFLLWIRGINLVHYISHDAPSGVESNLDQVPPWWHCCPLPAVLQRVSVRRFKGPCASGAELPLS